MLGGGVASSWVHSRLRFLVACMRERAMETASFQLNNHMSSGSDVLSLAEWKNSLPHQLPAACHDPACCRHSPARALQTCMLAC